MSRIPSNNIQSSKTQNHAIFALAGSASISSITAASSITTNAEVRQDSSSMNKYQLDLNIINQKIVEINSSLTPVRSNSITSAAIPSPASSSSNFVTNLRALANDIDIEKTNNLQRLLDRLFELDRLVLKKTLPQTPSHSSIEPRRKQGCDLTTFPTHMQLIDRLLDLYTQVKRPTVDHSITLQMSPRRKTALAVTGESIETSRISTSDQSLMDRIAKLSKLLEDSESRNKSLDAENLKNKRKIQSLQSEVETLKTRVSQLKESNDSNNKSKHDSYALVTELNNLRASHQEYKAAVIKVMKRKTELTADLHFASASLNYESLNINGETASAFLEYDRTLFDRTQELLGQIDVLKSIKDTYESELNSYHLEKDLYRKDLQTRSDEFEALQVAYNSLQTDHAALQRQLAVETNNQSTHFEQQLNESQRIITNLQSLVQEILPLKEQLILKEKESITNQTIIKQLQEENESYRKLNETLKNKLKSMSVNPFDGKEFLDTFEEVMRDEMMTMKSAFEAKLKAAREEADELTRQHVVEIQRMKSLNSQFLEPTLKTFRGSLPIETSTSKNISFRSPKP